MAIFSENTTQNNAEHEKSAKPTQAPIRRCHRPERIVVVVPIVNDSEMICILCSHY